MSVKNTETRVALVTGGGRGIGAHTARALAANGIAVALCGRDIGACEAVRDEIVGDGGLAYAVACDVTDYDQVATAVAETVQHFGHLDILISNAGIITPEELAGDADPAAWGKNIDINLTGAFHAARAALPHIQASPDGVIVAVTGGAAYGPFEGWSAYCASKAGVAMLCSCLHAEYGDKGVRVYDFTPGPTDTDMQVEIRARAVNWIGTMERTELGSPARPAAIIAWLTSADASDLAGERLRIQDETLRHRAGLAD